MSRGWSGGSTTRWRKLRAYILERDHWQCTIAAPGCTRRATEVDHIIEKAMGGTDEPTNLRAVCKPCHQGRTRARPEPEPPHKQVTLW